jgi:hypothetical protein
MAPHPAATAARCVLAHCRCRSATSLPTDQPVHDGCVLVGFVARWKRALWAAWCSTVVLRGFWWWGSSLACQCHGVPGCVGDKARSMGTNLQKKNPRAVRMGKSNQAGKTLTHTEDHLNFVTKVLFCKCYRIDWCSLVMITVEWTDCKFHNPCVRVSELLSVLSFLIRQ